MARAKKNLVAFSRHLKTDALSRAKVSACGPTLPTGGFFVLLSARSEGTGAAPVGTRQTSVPAAAAADLFVSRLHSGHAASASRARRGAAGRAPGNLPRTARRARRRGSRASRRRGLARPETTAQLGLRRGRLVRLAVVLNLPPGPATWRACPAQPVQPCVFWFCFGGTGREGKRLRHGCGYRAVYFRRNFRSLSLRSLAHNDSHLENPTHCKGLAPPCDPTTGEGGNTSGFRSRRGRAGPVRQSAPGRDPLTEGRRRGGSLGPGSPGPARRGGPTRPS